MYLITGVSGMSSKAEYYNNAMDLVFNEVGTGSEFLSDSIAYYKVTVQSEAKPAKSKGADRYDPTATCCSRSRGHSEGTKLLPTRPTRGVCFWGRSLISCGEG